GDRDLRRAGPGQGARPHRGLARRVRGRAAREGARHGRCPACARGPRRAHRDRARPEARQHRARVMPRTAVVTDSTASLPAALAGSAAVTVVPLHVVVDDVDHLEGVDLSTADLVAALRAGTRVTTSQPGPEVFARTYARLAAEGAREIVSVHLSGELSGTVTSAATAAQTAAVPVHVVDSRTVGMALGLGALAAAEVAAAGGSGAAAARAAAARS